jgi:hypothetical protein
MLLDPSVRQYAITVAKADAQQWSLHTTRGSRHGVSGGTTAEAMLAVEQLAEDHAS